MTTRKLKVTTMPVLTQAEQETLQRLGCEASPYVTWTHELVFAAYCSTEQEQALRTLASVTNVEPMPTYRIDL